MSTIPISQIAQVIPSVIGAGGAASRLVGVLLTQDASIPPGQPQTFFTAATADSWFGPGTPEQVAAEITRHRHESAAADPAGHAPEQLVGGHQ